MEVRDQILQGASELFPRYGIKSITMDEIARHLSISKKTIYQCFEDKDILVCSFVKEYLAQRIAELDEIRRTSIDVIDEMIRTTEFMKSKVCNISPTLMFDMKKYHQSAFKLFLEYKMGHLHNFITETMKIGIEQGFFRKDINIEILAKMRMEQVELGFNTDVYPTDIFNTGEVQMQLFIHFVYGIVTVKGHERFSELKPQTYLN